MQVIYALFKTYGQARDAANVLSERGYDLQEMNAIVHEEVRDQQELGAGLQRAHEARSAGHGTPPPEREPLQGLDRLVGEQRPTDLPGVGRVVAGGNLATLLIKAALDPTGPGPGLAPALAQFLPSAVAQRLAQGVAGGQLLFWLRTADERASEAASVLRKASGASEVRVA